MYIFVHIQRQTNYKNSIFKFNNNLSKKLITKKKLADLFIARMRYNGFVSGSVR